MWSPDRRKPASTAATTASSSGSAFRPMFRSACRASAANPTAARPRVRGDSRTGGLSGRRFPNVSRQQNAPEAQGELHYHDTSAIENETARFKRIDAEGKPFAEGFMTAPSPGIIASTMLNAFYDTNEAYLAALAREMSKEYMAIHKAGLVLQIDAPDLAMDRTMFYRDGSDADFVKAVELHVAMINKGIEGIPPTGCGCSLLRQQGRPAHSRHRAGENPARALPGQRRRAVDRVFQSASRARIPGAQTCAVSEAHAADTGRRRNRPAISSSTRKWSRGGSRKPWRRSATASG